MNELWSTARLLSEAVDSPWSSHEEVENPEMIVVIRDDDAHPVRNYTNRSDTDPPAEQGIWVKVCECYDERHAIKIANAVAAYG